MYCTRKESDILGVDHEELDASEIHAKRLSAKEVILPKKITIPSRRWNSTTFWRRSGTENINLDTESTYSRRKSRESKGSPPPIHFPDSFPDAGEARNDFWSMSGNFIYRHHVEPRVKLHTPREESFPISLKYFDVSRTTHTNLDVKQERRIDDYWNIDGSTMRRI